MRGAVVAPQPRAAEVGAKVLAAGGNAFDAALATGFAQMVVDPWMCSVGGFGTALVRTNQGEAVVIEFGATAGGKVRPDMWAAEQAGRTKISSKAYFEDHRNQIGFTSVCTPGTVAGFWEVHRRYASLPWHELIRPAIEMARNGVHVAPAVSDYLYEDPLPGMPTMRKRIRATDSCASLYLGADGDPVRTGAWLVNEAYADTLERIAEGGADEFYRGDIADRIVQDMEANEGFVTREDLAAYEPIVGPPLTVSYRGHDVLSAPPPVGGVILLQLLKVLEHFDVGAYRHNGVEYLDLLVSAMKLSHSDRRRFMGDPRFQHVPVDDMLSDETARQYARRIGTRDFPQRDDWDISHDHTTHVSALDAEGNCASITHSVGSGSGTISDGLGFLFNNSMMLFDPQPGRPNSIAPGKARIRGSCPTVVLKDSAPRLVTGAPGGSVIISATLQTILNVLDFGMSAVEAVSAPRIHCEGGAAFLEARFPGTVSEALTQRGHDVEVRVESYDRLMSASHLVVVDGDERVTGGADPRRDSGVVYAEGSEVYGI